MSIYYYTEVCLAQFSENFTFFILTFIFRTWERIKKCEKYISMYNYIGDPRFQYY